MSYPDWVLKHKKKGTYINHVKGRYYLYAAHSERVPGTQKVRRVCDGYLGRITQEDGFIPARDKVSTGMLVYEFGFSAFAIAYCQKEWAEFAQKEGTSADWILVASILTVLHGSYDNQKYARSYLSILYPGMDLSRCPDDVDPIQIEERGVQIWNCLAQLPDEDRMIVDNELPYVYKIRLNNSWYVSKLNDTVKVFVEKHGLKWRE